MNIEARTLTLRSRDALVRSSHGGAAATLLPNVRSCGVDVATSSSRRGSMKEPDRAVKADTREDALLLLAREEALLVLTQKEEA